MPSLAEHRRPSIEGKRGATIAPPTKEREGCIEREEFSVLGDVLKKNKFCPIYRIAWEVELLLKKSSSGKFLLGTLL